MNRFLASFLLLVSAAGCHRSTEFTVRLRNAHGLTADSPVVYRDREVGTVLSVATISDGVDVSISTPHETPLYREAQYFVETVQGRVQLTVHDAGQSRAPIRTGEVIEGSEPLEFTVRFSEAHGLRAGIPVLYRGLPIGTVTSVTPAAAGVDAKLDVILVGDAQLYQEATYRYEVADDGRQLITVVGSGVTVLQAGDIVKGTIPVSQAIGDAAARIGDKVSDAIRELTK